MNFLNLASSNFQRTRRNVHLIQHEDVRVAACTVLEIRELVRNSIMVLKAMLEKKGIFRCSGTLPRALPFPLPNPGYLHACRLRE